jgi:trigger factor
MSGTIQNKKAKDAKAPTEAKGYSESDSHVADPTAMSGTLDTSGTSGRTETAADVSPVFEVADEQAQEAAPEGTAFAPEPDPAATGEDALKPAYEEGTGSDEAEDDEAQDEAKAEEKDSKDEAKSEQFDPSEHTVAQVREYLETADEDEKKRVLKAEKKGENRKTLVEG